MAMLTLSVEHVRAICEIARTTMAAVPERSVPKSRRRTDTDTLRSTAGGGGRERADLLDRLSVEVVASVGQATLLIDGLADLLQVAVTDRDKEVNAAPAAAIVRSALEVAGQVDWLVGDDADAVEHCRRYLVWRFEDLKQLRLGFGNGRSSDEVSASGLALCDGEEAALIASAEAARFDAKPQVVNPNGSVEPAKLLSDGRGLSFPKYIALVDRIASEYTYHSLSAVAHGQRYNTLGATAFDPDTGLIRMAGSLVAPDMLVGWGCSAVLMAAVAVGHWNGIDVANLQSLALPLIQRALQSAGKASAQ